jgi:inner membrane protein
MIGTRGVKMLVFAHVGFALAGALVLDAVVPGRHCANSRTAAECAAPPQRSYSPGRFLAAPAARLESLADRIDIRFLFLGALLPDIIDKPIGRVFFEGTFENGRIFAHTLVFLVVLTLIGLYMYKKRASLAGLTLSFGVLTHLLLDAMWQLPQTLFWPLYGFSFDKYYTDLYSWSGIQHAVEEVLARPIIVLPEFIGAVVVMWFLWRLVKTRHLYAFLRYGRA